MKITSQTLPSSATDYTWIGGANTTSWTDACNWSPKGVPTSVDNVIFNSNPTYLLNITDSRTVNNFTLNGTGNFNMSATGVLTISGNVTYGATTTTTLDCASKVNIASTNSQTIPPLNYGNLDTTGGDRVLLSNKTVGICNVFTPGNGTYTVNQSTINYNGTSNQSISNKFTYYNLTLSGSGTKTPSGAISVDTNGTVKITGTAIANFTNYNLASTSANTTAFTMDGGRLILGTTGTQPNMRGAYNLTGGVVEFANTNASAQTIRTASYQNIEVTGNNVGNSSGNITLNSAGTFTVKSGGIFSINDNSITCPSGNGSITVENNGVFKTGNNKGFSGFAATLSDNSAIHANITNITLSDGSTVEYTRAANQVITEFNTLSSSPSTTEYSTKGYYNLKVSGDNGIGTTGATVTAKTLATNRVYVRNDLLISDTKALLSIEANKAINVYNNVTNSGDETNLVVESDGNLIQSKSTSINGNTGKITLKRNANLKRLDYNYWGSPVSGQSFINFSPSTLANRFYYYNEVDNSFAIIPDVNSNFVAGKGYAIRAPNNYTTNPKTFPGTFKGVPNNGDITIILNYTDATKGKNMVANPYPSNIDLRLLHQKNSVSGGTFYFWTNDANSWVSNVVTPNGSYGVYSLNQYAVLNIIGSTPAATKADLSPKYPSAIIKPGQGFIIQATSQGNLTFDNSMRTNSITDGTNPSEFFNRISSGGFKKDNSSMSRYWLSLISEAGAKNTILVGYVNDAKNGYEANYDAEILSDSSDNLYSLIADKKYAIQGRDNANLIKDIVPIGLSAYIPGSYTLKIDHLDGVFNNGQAIYLKDKLENKIVNLISQDYNFTINTGGKQDNRFEIVYQPESALAVENVKDNGLVIYENNNKIFIEANRIFNEVKIVDTSGRLLNTIKSGKKQLVIEKNKLVVGVNVLSIIFANEIINKKIISK